MLTGYQDGEQAPPWRQRLPIASTAATAMLVGELDTRLRFLDGLPDQVHRPGAMAAFVCGGFPQRAERLLERRQGTFHIALIGVGGFRRRTE